MPVYGQVIGRFVTAQADSVDVGTDPDFLPLTGSITFTPNVSHIVDDESFPEPLIIVPVPITAVLDASGYLSTPGADGITAAYAGIYLVATNDPDLNPTDFQYIVTYSLKYAGIALPLPAHNIVLLAGTTVDLALVVPVADAPAMGVAAAEAAAAAAIEAANSAARVVIVNTGSEARPAGALVVIWVDLRVSPPGNPTNSTTNDIVLRPI
jgi:hypothetical protein